MRLLGHRREERVGELGPALRGGRVQRREVVVGVARRAPAPAGVDLRLGQRAGQRLEQRAAELEVRSRGNSRLKNVASHFSNCDRGRQHVVGAARGLGHRDVDHDHEVERGERLAHALAVGERVHRVAALDDHRPEAVGMVGEDLVGDHVAGHEPGDDAVAADGRAPVDRRPCRHRRGWRSAVWMFIPPGFAKLPVSS